MTTKTIAVLPFVNISANQENEYFSDGITEEIINALAKIKSLKVTSRTSSFYFKNKRIPIKEISRELNVSAILEGSVRLSGEMIRITAQLIQAEKDFHFWSETWDRKLENIFEIQDEISLLIADKLREHFGHLEIQDHLVNRQTKNLDAYAYSLKAKFHFNKWNPEEMQIAIPLFKKALELDPNHTESLVGLADCYGFMATTGFMPFEEAWGKASTLTHRALQLNDQLPGAYYQLANLAFFTAGDFQEAYRQNVKAITLNPNYVEAQQFMAYLHVIAGEKEKARQHLERALSIDPLSQETLFFNAYFQYMMEDFPKALAQLEACLTHNPKNLPAYTIKCYCLLKMHRADEVLTYIDTIPADSMVSGDRSGLSCLAYAIKKDLSNKAVYLAQLTEEAKSPEGFRASSYLFLLYAMSGESDLAFDWVSQALKNYASLLLVHFADPLVDPIKNDPRYLEFQRVLFPEDLSQEVVPKKKPLLDDDAVAIYSARLLQHIQEEKPYLDPNLSLRSLADQITIHPNQLSWLLNESIGKNFNEFVNHYRVETFIKLSRDPNNAHITLIGLAFESGFNSKTVFNTYFKKETGMTPKQFLKQPQ